MAHAFLFHRIRNNPDLPLTTQACTKLPFCLIPIAQTVIGAAYLNDCPRQPNIPIYLIVVGVFTLMVAVLSCLPCSKKPKDGTTSTLHSVYTICNVLMCLFLFCWFIAGNVWIYSIYEPNYNKSSTTLGPYCNRAPYLFAFWITTITYVVIIMCLLRCCCCLLCWRPHFGNV